MANKVITRSFSTREKILLLIMVILAIAALYYFGLVKNVIDAQAENTAKLDEIEIQTQAQTALAARYTSMQQRLDALGPDKNLPVVAVYDNLENELMDLYAILENTTDSALDFKKPTLSDKTVRREIKISFITANYDSAFAVVSALQDGKYRSLVNDITMNGKLYANGEVESVSTSLTVTFFETTSGSINTSGLETENK